MQPTHTSEADIATKFVAARAAGTALADFPGAIPATLADAYRVQDLGIAKNAGEISGWKVGRILSPLAERYGCDRLAGPIFKKSIQVTDSAQPAIGLIFSGGFGAVEAEFLFRLGAAPSPTQTKFSLEQAAELIDSVYVGIEIASSPLATINHLGAPVVISDFGNNNGLIVGAKIEAWRTAGLANWPVATIIDGVQVGQGYAAAFPDGPIGSVRFLLELMAARGIALKPGAWVSTGAVSGVHDVAVGQVVEAQFGPDMKVHCTVAAMPVSAQLE